MEQIISIIQLCLFTFYIVYVWLNVGVLPSISESWYRINNNWMFVVILCFGVGLLQCIHNSIWYFLSGSSLCFVGIASQYKEWSITKKIHNIGAVTSIVSALIGLWYDNMFFTIVPILSVLTIIYIFKLSNKIFWIEVVSFYSIIINQTLK